MQKRKKEPLTAKHAAMQLTAIVERHLSGLPEEEQDLRVEMFARAVALKREI